MTPRVPSTLDSTCEEPRENAQAAKIHNGVASDRTIPAAPTAKDEESTVFQRTRMLSDRHRVAAFRMEVAIEVAGDQTRGFVGIPY